MFSLQRLIRQSLYTNFAIAKCYSTANNNSKMEKPILYGDYISPPVRFVMMTASVLGVELDFHKIDLFSIENRTEEYKKINPLMKVPALQLKEGGILIDSHAIALYLCGMEADQQLYPKDALERARVDEMLFFNSGSLFPLDSEIMTKFFAGQWTGQTDIIEKWNRLLDYLEERLNKTSWVAGDRVTLADLCCGSTLSSAELVVPVDEKYVNIKQWQNKLKALPCFEINSRGVNILKEIVDQVLSEKLNK